MKTIAKLTPILIGLFALLTAALPIASAQPAQQDCTATGTPTSATFTEDQINSTFWVTNPRNRNVSDVTVDLQPGQVAISETYTWRANGGTQTADVVVVLTPVISNGRVQWTVESITANGEPASTEIITQVNDSLMTSWRRWIADQAPLGHFTGVTITNDDITYFYTAWDRGCIPAELDDIFVTAEPSSDGSQASGSVTITEAQINSSFAVANPVNRNLSNVYVDLQPNQVAITATYSARTRSGVQSVDTSVTLVPFVSNGRVDWTVASATANNQAVSADVINQINDALNASWHRWIASQAPAGRVTGVSISSDSITYSY